MIKVIFFATPKIALKSLDYLVKSDKIEVLAIITQPDKPTGRGHKIAAPPIKEYATINLHASLLPLYRGANPIQRALINGDKKTGICTMVTDEGLDCGDICLRDEIEITENMNYEELFELIAQKAPELIEVTLLNIKSGVLHPTEQKHEKATYAHKINKEDAKIDWTKSAREIHNLVRGLYKAPCAHCYFRNKLVKVLQTRVLDDEMPANFLDKASGEIIKITKDGIEVATEQGILLICRVKPEGKGEMPAKDWVNGFSCGLKLIQGERFL